MKYDFSAKQAICVISNCTDKYSSDVGENKHINDKNKKKIIKTEIYKTDYLKN